MARKKSPKTHRYSLTDRILVCLSALMICGSALALAYVSLMNWSPLAEVVSNESGGNHTASIDQEIQNTGEAQEKTLNFLVTGIDYTTTDASAGTSRGKLTDVIMVVQLDLGSNEVDVLQIPRDTWVGTNASSTGKINAVYGRSGLEGLARTIYDQLSIPLDHYVNVNMDGFINIVDAIGGVEMEITESFTLEGVTFSPGVQTLSGIEAEKFVRERHHRSGGDIGRINAQRAFHAPLAGVMFALEEIHKGFSVSLLISVMTASVTADYICSHIMGIDPVFQFELEHVLPQNYYWMLLILGVILGFLGAFYNKVMIKAQELYKKPKFSNETTRLVIAFLAAGVLGLLMPSVLGSGGDLIVSLTDGEMMLQLVILTFVVKFLFSAVSFGSGAPGGIFFPLLILGALIGGAFAMAGVELFGLNPVYINNFVLLAMAGFFTAIVRAPITGIILLFEMSGSVSQMLSLAVVSVVAYITATLLKSEPIYESLLNRLLDGQKKENESGENSRRQGAGAGRQKVLSEFVIMSGSVLEDRTVMEIHWPNNCLLVALERDGKEMIPRGKTRLMAGDRLTVMTDERDAGYIHDKLENLCYTSF